MWAAAEGNTAAASMLLEFGADLRAQIEGRLHAAAVRCPRGAPARPLKRC